MMRRSVVFAAVLGLGLSVAHSQEQSSNGNCSPLLAKIDGNVKIVCIVVTRKEDALAIAKNNVNIALELRRVFMSNVGVFLPNLEDYINDPSKANWKSVVDYARTTSDLVDSATKSAIIYGALADKPEIEKQAQEILGTLRGRTSLLNAILVAEQPMPREEAQKLDRKYGELIAKLVMQLDALDKTLGPLAN